MLNPIPKTLNLRISILEWQPDTSYSSEERAHCKLTQVQQVLRNHGIGKSLYNELKKWCAAQGPELVFYWLKVGGDSGNVGWIAPRDFITEL